MFPSTRSLVPILSHINSVDILPRHNPSIKTTLTSHFRPQLVFLSYTFLSDFFTSILFVLCLLYLLHVPLVHCPSHDLPHNVFMKNTKDGALHWTDARYVLLFKCQLSYHAGLRHPKWQTPHKQGCHQNFTPVFEIQSHPYMFWPVSAALFMEYQYVKTYLAWFYRLLN